MKTADALKTAQDQGFDLVEVSPNASPPVCRLMDYGKYKYQQTKKIQKKKTPTTSVVKEIKFRPFTGEHDLEVKIRHIQDFLEKGLKVKVSVIFRGREMKFQDNGEAIMQRIIDDTNELGTAERDPKMQGNSMQMHITPKKTK